MWCTSGVCPRPLLITSNYTPLAAILRVRDIGYHVFADDTQPYLEFSLLDNTKGSETIKRMKSCVAMVRSWMHHNTLGLNDEKTELSSAPALLPQHRLPHTNTVGSTQTEATKCCSKSRSDVELTAPLQETSFSHISSFQMALTIHSSPTPSSSQALHPGMVGRQVGLTAECYAS